MTRENAPVNRGGLKDHIPRPMQYLSPKQALAYRAYHDPRSPTFGMVRQSLHYAGFSGKNRPTWLMETVDNQTGITADALKDKAREVLLEAMDNEELSPSVRVDAAKHVSKHVDEQFSTKQVSEKRVTIATVLDTLQSRDVTHKIKEHEPRIIDVEAVTEQPDSEPLGGADNDPERSDSVSGGGSPTDEGESASSGTRGDDSTS